MGTEDISHRVLPQSIEVEMCVLGAIFIDREAAGTVFEMLGAGYFYSTAHQEIYQVMLHLYEHDRAIDVVTVAEELKNRKLLERVGGPDYLARLMEAVPSSANVEYYAQIVRDKGLRRNLINTVAEIQREAVEEGIETAELLDRAEKLIFDVADKGMTQAPQEIQKILHGTMERIDEYSQRKGVVRGLETGFRRLDEKTSGLQDSEFIILAARPGVGKTALALNIAEHVGVDRELPVALFSLEMSSSELGERMVCSRAKVDLHKIRGGFARKEDWPHINLAFGELSEAKIFIDDTPSLTPLHLRGKARRLKSQHDIRLIIVDYLQLMETTRAENRTQEISQISRSMKALARELDVPLLAVSQLNRAPTDRVGGRPRLSDLRESGALEQDADMVLLLHRESYQAETEGGEKRPDSVEDRTAILTIAKQRNGPIGDLKLTWMPEYVRFASYTDQQP